MDVLSQLLEAVELRGSVFCFGEVRAPWRFEGGAPNRCLFHAVVEGEAWLGGHGPARRLTAGDVVLMSRGGTHRLGSTRQPGTALPLSRVVGRAEGAPFARFTIGGSGSRSYLICGSFEVDGMDWHPLLCSLPDVLVVNAGLGRWLRDTITSLERYLDREEPGASLITRRLTEILFVQVLATWLEQRDQPAGWLCALSDQQVGRAIGLLHAEPARAWSVAALARSVGMSRSAFFGRWKSLVGEPPAKYLLRWRMTLAGRALARETAPVAEISERVGFASVPSFTKAFRRHHGDTPAVYRHRQRSA